VPRAHERGEPPTDVKRVTRAYLGEIRGNALWDLTKVVGYAAIGGIVMGAYAVIQWWRSVPAQLQLALGSFGFSLVCGSVALIGERLHRRRAVGSSDKVASGRTLTATGAVIPAATALQSARAIAPFPRDFWLVIETHLVYASAVQIEANVLVLNRSFSRFVSLTFMPLIEGPPMTWEAFGFREDHAPERLHVAPQGQSQRDHAWTAPAQERGLPERLARWSPGVEPHLSLVVMDLQTGVTASVGVPGKLDWGMGD
jgi:hypothetical protein